MTERQFTTDWVTHAAPQWLEHLSRFKGLPIDILEIGTYEGRAACWFADNIMQHSDATLTSVDPSPRLMTTGQAYWRYNLTYAQLHQCALVERTSDLFFSICHHKYHVIYVDGDHWGGSVVKDGINAWNALRVGGVLIFDDYLWTGAHETHEQPKAAIDYLLSLYQGRYTILDHSWQIILKKTSN